MPKFLRPSDAPRPAKEAGLPAPRLGPAALASREARGLVLAGLFVALIVVFSFIFAIQTPLVRIGFGFLPLALYGALAGPWRAAGVAMAADFLGANLFGGGNYFPGITLTAGLAGLLYGWSFHGRRVTPRRAALTILAVDILGHLLLNTFWLALLYGKGAAAVLAARLPKIVLSYPVEISLFLAVYRAARRFGLFGEE